MLVANLVDLLIHIELTKTISSKLLCYLIKNHSDVGGSSIFSDYFWAKISYKFVCDIIQE